MKIFKQLIKGILFVGIFLLIFNTLSTIFEPKNNDKKSGTHQASAYAVQAEKENTIDTLIIGDSLSYCTISPMEIWKEYGYTSYVCGTPAQPLNQSYDMLKKALVNQKPKIVILEANTIYRKKSFKGMIADRVQEELPLFKYHDRWKSITSDDFTKSKECTWVDDFKGFRYNNDVNSAKSFSYMKKTKKKQETISNKSLYFLDKIHQLCQDNDIKFVIMSVPSLKNWNYAKHQAMVDYAKENNIEYIDMNLMNDELKIDWKTDTRDRGDHLNYKGALKVTRYLGRYLKESNLVESHQNDKDFDHWNQSLKKYEKKVK